MNKIVGKNKNSWQCYLIFVKPLTAYLTILIPKLNAYDFEKVALSLIYSYLKNRKLSILTMYRALSYN